MTNVVHKSLARAKLAVMEEVGYCLKTTSQGLNYTYASEAELIAALRPALIKHGIVVSPVGVADMDMTRYETKRGNPMFVTRMVVTYRFTHAESDQFEDVVVAGEGGDVGDKDVPKAMTCAFKYALRQAFMIETGDDPDRFASQPAQAEARLDKSVQLAMDAIAKAGNIETLEKYRAAYLSRGFSDDQIESLETAFGERLSDFENQEERTEE